MRSRPKRPDSGQKSTSDFDFIPNSRRGKHWYELRGKLADLEMKSLIPIVAIMIACVGSLRSLFTQDDHLRSRSNPTPLRLDAKTIRESLYVRSGRSRVYSLDTHERKGSMTIPLAQVASPPLRADSLQSRGLRGLDNDSEEFDHQQVPR